jgi:predicted DNA-binding ribbon-helix-helix protein
VETVMTGIKRTVAITRHKATLSLEDAFWKSRQEIASEWGISRPELIAAIDGGREHGNLSSAIRLFVLDSYCP